MCLERYQCEVPRLFSLGCQDIDDALHARTLPNGNFEVGVHIADVSHFVKPNNAMDKEASLRGTTVYLVDKRIDMFVALIITIVGLLMLIVPLWVLAFVGKTTYRLAIITAFVVIFLCFVSFTTVARPFETLGAAAA